MLTELRDINKVGTCSPVFYYVIAYVTPTLIVSLTLGIKQDIYTNANSALVYAAAAASSSSTYCWLNLSDSSELFVVFALPMMLISAGFLLVCLMCYQQRKESTNFKPTDLGLVYHALISSLIILCFMSLQTFFLVKFLSDQIVNLSDSSAYQHFFAVFALSFSLILFLLFVCVNKFTKKQMHKSWLSLKNSTSSLLNESLNASKTKLNAAALAAVAAQPILKSALLAKNENNLYQMSFDQQKQHQQQLGLHQYVLDYHNHTQSVSTTTTSGTMDNFNGINNTTDDINSQTDSTGDYLKSCNHLLNAMDTTTSNGYLSHLANTTNGESTTNTTTATPEESEFNYDFNRPALMQQIYSKNDNTNNIPESDVVDVGAILKSRQQQQQQQNYHNQHHNQQFKYALNQMMPNDNTNKYYNDQCDSNGGCELKIESNQVQNANLFWPSTIAECDTSFLEGSVVYAHSKPPPLLKQKQQQIVIQADLLLPQYLNEPQIVNGGGGGFKNHSYNSEGSSASSNSTSLQHHHHHHHLQQQQQQQLTTGIFATSNSSSSLIMLNGEVALAGNNTYPNFNLNYTNSNNICPVFTHTGSPNSSDNDDSNSSNNETRV
jgi:hypothetical protein